MERNKILELREKELEEIKRIDAADILRDTGARIVKESKGYILAHAPYRHDKDPSLNYFRNSRGHWIWKDMATGESGTHIDLLMKTYNYDYVDAVKYLRENFLYGNTHTHTQQKSRDNTADKEKEEKISWKVEDIQEMELSETHRKALEKERGYLNIPETVKTYLATIRKEENGRIEYKKQYGYGIKDINGNVIVRVKGQDGTYTKEKRNWKLNKEISISHIDNGKNKVMVVEGLHDYIAAYQKYGNNTDYIVMNSINNVDKAIEYLNKSKHNNILLALDNDKAGIQAQSKMIDNIDSRKKIYVAIYKEKDLDELYRKDKKMEFEAAGIYRERGIEMTR